MDRYSINKQLLKMISYVRGLKKSGTGFYKSGRDGWLDNRQLGFVLVKEITDMLQLEQLDDIDPDFNASSIKNDYVTHDQLQSMLRELTKLPDASSLGSVDVTGQSPEKLVEDYIKMSNEDVIRISRNYNRILEKMAKTDCGSPIVNQCANMLWRWYEARFIKKYRHVPKFNYDICRLKRVIYHLVLMFGYCHEHGELHSHLSTFDDWVCNLNTSPTSHTWIAPWEVFKCEQNAGTGYANLSAVVIWDVLLDNGLMDLCKMTPHNSVYPRDNQVWELVESIDIEVLNPYVNYKEDASILSMLKLIEGGGTVND